MITNNIAEEETSTCTTCARLFFTKRNKQKEAMVYIPVKGR